MPYHMHMIWDLVSKWGPHGLSMSSRPVHKPSLCGYAYTHICMYIYIYIYHIIYIYIHIIYIYIHIICINVCMSVCPSVPVDKSRRGSEVERRMPKLRARFRIIQEHLMTWLYPPKKRWSMEKPRKDRKVWMITGGTQSNFFETPRYHLLSSYVKVFHFWKKGKCGEKCGSCESPPIKLDSYMSIISNHVPALGGILWDLHVSRVLQSCQMQIPWHL